MIREARVTMLPRQMPLAHTANTPATRAGDSQWDTRITEITADLAAKQGIVDLLLFGQSITQLWTDAATGLPVYNAFYVNKGRRPMNQGISGDTTQSMLYRIKVLDHLRGIAPKLTILEAATNNYIQEFDVEITVDGIVAVINAIRLRLPTSKILVMSTFPSNAVGDPIRNRINASNALLRQQPVFDFSSVYLFDLYSEWFLTGTENINTTLLPDSRHPSEIGFRLWASRIEPFVASVLG
jgi:lysophospholipase L1-like esterase